MNPIPNSPCPERRHDSYNYQFKKIVTNNRLARTSTLPAIPSTTATYNANDRLNSDGYDANGNTTSADGRTFTYNFENRIKSVDGGAVTVTYDGDGNRVAKTVAGVTTRYLVDDLNPTGYAQVIEDVVGGSVERTYTYGNTLVSQNQPGNGQLTASFYGTDAHGSVRLLTDSAGEVTNTYAYDAFGNLVSAFGSTPNDYLYSGERFDSDLGAYHLRERDYSPQRGRFLTSDPFAGFTDLPRTLHKYLYVGADPVNFIDPSGLAETTEYRPKPPPRLYVRILCTAAKVAAAAGPDPYLSVTADVVTLVVCGCKPATGTTLAENKLAGDAFRDELIDLFKKEGYDVGKEVGFPTPFGERRFDLVVRKGGEIIYAIESKIGNSRYRSAQRAKDLFLKRFNKVPVLLVRKGCR